MTYSAHVVNHMPMLSTQVLVENVYPAYEQDYTSLKAGIDTSIKYQVAQWKDVIDSAPTRYTAIMRVVLKTLAKFPATFVGGSYAASSYLATVHNIRNIQVNDLDIYCTDTSILPELINTLVVTVSQYANLRLMTVGQVTSCVFSDEHKMFDVMLTPLPTPASAHAIACSYDTNTTTVLFHPATLTWQLSHRFVEYLNTKQIVIAESSAHKLSELRETKALRFPHVGLVVSGRKVPF